MSDKTSEIDKNFSEWATEAIMNDQFVSSFSNGIMSNPVWTLTDKNEEKKFYSANQMIEMFRAGFLSMTKQEFDKKIFEKASKPKLISPFKTMKQMKVGAVAYFPYSKWTITRQAASILKSRFGCVFHVSKVTDYGTVGNIKVIRVK